MEDRLSEIERRLAAIEEALGGFLSQGEQQREQLRRTVEMRTARAGEMSSRIAQRIAKLETAVEILAKIEIEDADNADAGTA